MLNEQLHQQIMEYKRVEKSQSSFTIPEGYTLVNNESLNKMIAVYTDINSKIV